jgi:hypothetical protein
MPEDGRTDRNMQHAPLNTVVFDGKIYITIETHSSRFAREKAIMKYSLSKPVCSRKIGFLKIVCERPNIISRNMARYARTKKSTISILVTYMVK